MMPTTQTRMQQIEQGHLKRFIADQLMELDLPTPTDRFKRLRMLRKSSSILPTRNFRVDVQFAVRFEVAKQRRLLKRKVDFGRVEHAQQAHLVPLRAEVTELLL